MERASFTDAFNYNRRLGIAPDPERQEADS